MWPFPLLLDPKCLLYTKTYRIKKRRPYFMSIQVGDTGLEQVMAVGGSKFPVMTVDWCHTLQCGTSIAAALDGTVTVATLMHQ